MVKFFRIPFIFFALGLVAGIGVGAETLQALPDAKPADMADLDLALGVRDIALSDIPRDLSSRVRVVSAEAAPSEVVASGWGPVGSDGWTEWRYMLDTLGKGASILSVELPGCRNFTVELQLAAGEKILGTWSETGQDRHASFFIPGDAFRAGADPTSHDFLTAVVPVTVEARRVFDFWERELAGRGDTPRRYSFETFMHGLGIGWYPEAAWLGEGIGRGRAHSSPEVVKGALRVLRLVGYNSFVWEKNIQRADYVGMRSDFNQRLTFHHYGPPYAGAPCPFDEAQLVANRQQVLGEVAAGKKYPDMKEGIWLVWGDEIGVAAKNDHIVGCSACADGYRAYLQGLGLKPETFGETTWGAVLPYGGERSNSVQAVSSYYTFRFWTYATARAYELGAKALQKEGVRMYPLQGATPAANGHSIDFFEFYDTTPTTTIAWETSARDARAWQWDIYLADMTRTISRTHGDLPVLVYVKPHRGATIQRLLGAASRGIKAFNWYDDETGLRRPNGQHPRIADHMRNQARAARMLAVAEDVTYDAKRVPERAEVALISPRSAQIVCGGRAPFQDAKWVWTALRHEGYPVDVIGERLIESGDLEGRKALYVVGMGLRQKSFEAVRDWVAGGGTLWTDIGGLATNEFAQPLAGAETLTGRSRPEFEFWGEDPGYATTGLEGFRGMAPGTPYEAPAHAAIQLGPVLGGGEAKAAIGRETLSAQGGEVLATFADGRPAAVVRRVGKGTVYLIGTHAGLAYGEKVRRNDFDMSTDFDPAFRRLITVAASSAAVERLVVVSAPTVEAVRVRNGADEAVFLMNWTWRRGTNQVEQVPARSLRVELPGVDPGARIVSSAGNRFTAEASGNGLAVTLESLEDGDILVVKGKTESKTATEGERP